MPRHKRQFESMATSQLEFAIGVGKATLTNWRIGAKRYKDNRQIKECEKRIKEMEEELKSRRNKNHDEP